MLAELTEVSKSYSTSGHRLHALSGVSLTLEPGDFVAVCGPSGCGKSTLLMTLGGLLRPDSGTVVVGGKSIYTLTPNQRAQLRAREIGFVFQQFHLVPYLNVSDNILAARVGMTEGTSREVRRRAESLIELLGLSARVGHCPAELSTGERQRVALGRALLNSPRILLADEPTGNLDPANAAIVLDQLSEFARQGGAVLVVTHDPTVAQRTGEVVRMDQGRIVARGAGVPSQIADSDVKL